MELKVGDVVKLKTGGPEMTINMLDNEEGEIETVWFEPRDAPTAITANGNGWDGPFTGSFHAEALQKVR